MDPIIDNDWLGCKNDSVDEAQNVGNIARSWQWRERGIDPLHCPNNKTVLENIAEDILVQKPLKIRCCELPGYPRSTFLMVFSPDGTKVASTHGNHNVYVSELASGKHVRILKGHPRTPWCIAFHPSHPQLIGSGCLGGQVRVWDISSGGSEVWNVRNETVIASIAFHPREQLLVIATYNELYFWDWSQPAPFTKVSTNNFNEKVRYVAFDSLGYKLITGISLWEIPGGAGASLLHPSSNSPNNQNNNRRDDPDENSGNDRPQQNPSSAQEIIVNSYQNLVQRYDSLVRNYQRLFLVRHRLNGSPPSPSTMDRGTDPMDLDLAVDNNVNTLSARSNTSSSHSNTGNLSTPGPSNQQTGNNNATSSNADSSNSRTLLNLDVLSFDNNASREPNTSRPEHSAFGSRPSAFQRLNESNRRLFLRINPNERGASRLLPNPFSSTNSMPRPTRTPVADDTPQSSDNGANSSRTSIFPAYRPESSSLSSPRRRHRRLSALLFDNHFDRCNETRLNSAGASTSRGSPRNIGSTSSTNATQRSTTSNTSTQASFNDSEDADTINESLDLIRDILRDSGARLLNLITSMSFSSSRRQGSTRDSDDSESDEERRNIHPRIRLFSTAIQDAFFSSSSESDSSDQSLEVNILRTRNSTFREDDTNENDRSGNSTPTDLLSHPTDRLFFELDNDTRTENDSQDGSGFNVSSNSSRFHVRTQNDSAGEGPSTSNRDSDVPRQTQDQHSDNNRPSTSRDTFLATGSTVPPDEAFRRVKGGVIALQKHTLQLTNLWLRGNHTTVRELRNMWENLRRRILSLQRDIGAQDVPTSYTRSALERCMMLSDMNVGRELGRGSRSNQRSEENSRTTESSSPSVSREACDTNASTSTPRKMNRTTTNTRDVRQTLTANARDARHNPSSSNRDARQAATTDTRRASQTQTNNSTDSSQTPTNNTRDARPNAASNSRSSRSPQTRSATNARTALTLRRRLLSNYRLTENEIRRTRNSAAARLSQRQSGRPRRDITRAVEISATRHEIRMRAMQVLSVMFNMMMMCLEERGLSQLIITMLRTLKKALALTCLMLMSNRSVNRGSNTSSQTPRQRLNALNVIRIENVDHAGPVNVDGPDESPNNSITSEPEEDRSQNKNKESNITKRENSTTTQSTSTGNNSQAISNATLINSVAQRWSNRLAVQIAAANRNNSSLARNRREIYINSKREEALHRTNPTAHPIFKKRVLAPVRTHRIPALRMLPGQLPKPSVIRHRNAGCGEGPSRAANENTSQGSRLGSRLPPDVMNEFENRINLIRMAHMQAVRLRNVARNRFRRLQTIRLFTPSSVRERFTLQTNNLENRSGSQSPTRNASDEGGRSRPHFSPPEQRPHILGRDRIYSRVHFSGPPDERGHYHTVLNNVAMPLVQVNDLPVNSGEAQGSQPQRMPRIHEYLQPIILAQNAMIVDQDENGGGGGGGGGGGPGGGGGGGRGGAGGGGGASFARRLTGMAGLLDAGIISEALPAPSHRVQAWDFTTGKAPDISDCTKNVVVQRCRIHNDASIDISKDGRLLVALLPVPRLRNSNHWLGVYSLEWSRLGQCLHTAVLEQSAVSVALSPTARHLAVGLGSRRFTSAPHARPNVFALLYRLEPKDKQTGPPDGKWSPSPMNIYYTTRVANALPALKNSIL